MATTTSDFDIARLLNLSEADKLAYQEEINDFFAERNLEEEGYESEELEGLTESEDDDDDGADECTFNPIVNVAQQVLGRQVEEPSSEPEAQAPAVQPKAPCHCKLFNNGPCHLQFTTEQLSESKVHYQGLTRQELDLVVMAKIEAGIHVSEETARPKQKQQQKRELTRTDYYHLSHKICRDVFMFIHNIGKDKLYALQAHFRANGVESRVHGNIKRLPSTALKQKDTVRVIEFIVNYGETHGVTLPGRTQHHWNLGIVLLPTNCTKRTVFEAYKKVGEESNHRVVALRTFRSLWQQLLPFIKTMRPATDLCWQCQTNIAKVNRSANLDLEQKSEATRQMEEHLSTVTKERSYYTTINKEVKDALPAHMYLGPHPPCSYQGTVHYSFDFAQQILYPSDPLQPGPIFFKTPRKCGLFGVNCEALTRQVNFLIDEACSTGKGANCVISMLHFFFEHYGLGESKLHLHADNCSGQNKNSAMMWYLLWRVITGLNTEIKISFLITGHTKFSPDCGFGLIKRKFRRTRVSCLKDFEDVVSASSVMNISQKCGDEQDDIIVHTFDWTGYLGRFFTKVVEIKKNHHFRFIADYPGVETKKFSDSEPVMQNLLKSRASLPPVGELPPVVPPAGLSAARQWYLYREIRPFVDLDHQDTVAPLPLSEDTRAASSDSETDAGPPPKVKRSATSKGKGRGKSRRQDS